KRHVPIPGGSDIQMEPRATSSPPGLMAAMARAMGSRLTGLGLAGLCAAVLGVAGLPIGGVSVAGAQTQTQTQAQPQPQHAPAPAVVPPAAVAKGTAQPVAIPGFWDPRRRPERPDLSRVTLIRFLTEVDYPPFNYAGP